MASDGCPLDLRSNRGTQLSSDARSDAEKNSAHSQAVDGGGRSHNPEGTDSDVAYQVTQQAKPSNCIKGLTQLSGSLTVLVY